MISKHKVPSHPLYGRYLRRLLYAVAIDHGFRRNEAYEIKLAFSEAFNNIYLHAYERENNRPIIAEFRFTKTQLEIVLKDFGKRVPRSQIRSRPLSDIREFGLGVFLMESLMDFVQYDNSVTGQNTLRMVKMRRTT